MKEYRVKPDSRFRLKRIDPDDRHLCEDKEDGKKRTEKILTKLDALQEKLYASQTHALLIILQGMDTAGKDGTIRHVMSGVNPQSCQVSSFKVPTPEEKAHDFLWRIHQKTPPLGDIGIFNRSHYEDVLVTRVHGLISKHTAEKRMKEINQFEKLLASNGTTVLKFFLHISKEEQRKRLEARIEDPDKHWKFSAADLVERKKWDAYQDAFEDMISGTSTKHAPWYVVPSNHKWYRNWVVGGVIVKALEDMNLRRPAPDPSINFKKLKVRS